MPKGEDEMTMPISLPCAAAQRKVHPETLQRAARRGWLKVRRIGNAYATTLQDVDDYLEKHPAKVGRPRKA